MNEIFKLKQIFPEVKFEYGTKRQLGYVISECKEAQVELKTGNRELLLYKLIDVAHSAMTTLYKAGYSHHEINDGIRAVRAKNETRGYYLK